MTRERGTGRRTVVKMIDVSGKFARLVSIRFRPGTIDAAMERFHNVSAPLVRRQEGSLEILGVGNRETGSIMALSLWETRDTLERSNANPDVIEALAGYADWMEGPFVVEGFEVSHGVVPAACVDEPGFCVRSSIAHASPGRVERAGTTMTEREIHLEANCRQCLGSLVLLPLVGHKIVALDYWKSAAAFEASELRVNSIDQRLARMGVFQSPIQRERFELFDIL